MTKLSIIKGIRSIAIIAACIFVFSCETPDGTINNTAWWLAVGSMAAAWAAAWAAHRAAANSQR